MEIDPFKIIQEDLEKPRDSRTGLLQISTANEALAFGKRQPDPVNLFHDLFYEHEIVCLFADTGTGKSILATQIGEHIAKSQAVLYIDCELSSKQFQLRYTGDNGQLHIFPASFYRAELSQDATFAKDFEDRILKNIEIAAEKVNAKIIIIDNLTYLCNASEKGESASVFMKKLKEMKDKGFTILVIAHTPKRNLFSPITDCDLAGSRRLANFFDAIVAISRSARDNELRYIKQVKASRVAPERYSADNVAVCQLIKDNSNALRFDFIGYSQEREHLRVLSKEEMDNIEANVNSLKGVGLSCREIANELGISKSKVSRIINSWKGDKENE